MIFRLPPTYGYGTIADANMPAGERVNSVLRKQSATSNTALCTAEFLAWFSGFFDGEGCFIADLQPNRKPNRLDLRVQIEVKEDHSGVMQDIHKALGGLLYPSGTNWNRRHPTVLWRISDPEQLWCVIVPIFDKYPLRTMKGQQYLLWRRLLSSRMKRMREQKRGLSQEITDEARRTIEAIRSLRSNRRAIVTRRIGRAANRSSA